MRSGLGDPSGLGTPEEPSGRRTGATSSASAMVGAVGAANPLLPRGHGGSSTRWLARHPAWPITVLLIAYPLWWALGIADFMWMLLAIPMLSRMAAWRASGRRIRVPPGFGIWLVFIACAIAGIATLTLVAPGTVASSISHRVLSYGDRNLFYIGVTIMLVFAGNLTEEELPRRRFAWMLGLLAIYTTIGGVAGMVDPHFQFNSPFLLLLPQSVQSNLFIQASMHPGLAQIQSVFGAGTVSGRPKAPFDYTNLWGECLSLLVPFLLVAWWSSGTRRQRKIAVATVVIATAPLLYSLNRGVWFGVGFAIVYLGVRMAARGKLAVLGGMLALVALAAVLLLATPAQSIVSSRLSHGDSNTLRANLSTLAVQDGVASPIVGYGDTRQERGSPGSIAVGPSPACPSCGQQAVGSNGQLYLLLVCNGLVGTILYLAFFAYGCCRFWRDRTPYGTAGVLVLLLSFVYMFAYTAVGAPLGLTMLAYALLWKSDRFNKEHPALAESENADPALRNPTTWPQLALPARGPA